MATESIGQRTNDLTDPGDARAISALLNSILTDLNALKAAHNNHIHSAVGAPGTGTTPTAPNTVGNLNTTT